MGHLGELLHQRQVSLGISLADLQDRTKIREKYIDAIIQGNYDLIPGEVYLRGFIRSIAAELGIDAGEAMQAYYQDIGKQAKAAEEPGPSMPAAPVAEVSRDTTSAGTSDRREEPRPQQVVIPIRKPDVSKPPVTHHRPRRRKRRKRGPLLLLFAVMVLLSAGAWYWATYLRSPVTPPDDQPPIVDNEPNTEPPEENPEQVVTVTLTNPGERHLTYLVKPGPLQVRLTAEGEDCWVGITADGTEQQSTLRHNDAAASTLLVEASQQIRVRVGRPRALRLVINDQDQGILGGEVTRDITISVDPKP